MLLSRFSIVYVFLGLCLLSMIIIRPLLASKLLPGSKANKGFTYKVCLRSGKEFDLCCPLFSSHHCIHPQCFGRCCVLQVSNLTSLILNNISMFLPSYPYLTLLSSLVSCAAHFAFKLDQSLRSLLLSSITDSRNLTILLGRFWIYLGRAASGSILSTIGR